VVGLGNPGLAYASTRHNVGFRVAEAFAQLQHAHEFESRFRGQFAVACVDKSEIGILKPETFMNRSGSAVHEAVSQLALEDLRHDLLVVYDDLDLPFGRLRLRASGGSGGHRGMSSLIDSLGTQEYPRLRFGIGRPSGDQSPVEYVLEPFAPGEEQTLPQLLSEAALAIAICFQEGVKAAMNRVNPEPPAEPEGTAPAD
jgi:PTH1 family peptidyl-tRNA hydrolase